MDVEGAEIDSLTAMYEDGVLNKIKQIGVEVMVQTQECVFLERKA